jgi:hypothetical protein
VQISQFKWFNGSFFNFWELMGLGKLFYQPYQTVKKIENLSYLK